MYFEAILFDFDGVLVDSEPIHYECWTEILAGFGIEMSWEVYRKHGIGVPDRRMLEFLASLRTPPLEVDLLFAEYPKKKEMFRERMARNKAISTEMQELLEELASRFRLAVVTSSNASEVTPSLEKLSHLFATIVCGNDVQRLKPAPDPYLLAAERLAVTKALVVEDSDPGAEAGRAAGFEVLQVGCQQEVIPRVRARLCNFG